jgi:hypothetical protein
MARDSPILPILPISLPVPLFFRLAVLVLLACASAQAETRKFDLRRDSVAFSNDTVLAYGVDEAGMLHIHRRDKPVEYGHRCFVLTRSVMQFYQFARFDPTRPKVTREEYRCLVLQVSRVPVWSFGPRAPIIIPGFGNLHDFSVAYEGLLKENLGNWLPTYLRIGNSRIIMGHLRAGQKSAAGYLVKSCQQGRLRAVYLARFPHMNHVVVIYGMKQRPNGDVRFSLYDPNYPQKPGRLDYIAAQRSFEFQKRWYFPGGRVNVMRVYISPFH